MPEAQPEDKVRHLSAKIPAVPAGIFAASDFVFERFPDSESPREILS